ncbi:MAG: ABC transporter ATP-binding protein [Bacillota bacterium]|nr:ABC transporter ATP-binding protein [Bacillota bacterium]
MSAITTRNLTKNYGECAAVRSLNLEVQQGSVYGFLGPNGSGKTTTVKMLLGMNVPSDGDATVLGFDCKQDSIEICKRIGYVPENGNLYPFMTVGETISLVKSLRPSWDAVLGKRLLDTFELPLDRKVGKLSKGMQRQLE